MSVTGDALSSLLVPCHCRVSATGWPAVKAAAAALPSLLQLTDELHTAGVTDRPALAALFPVIKAGEERPVPESVKTTEPEEDASTTQTHPDGTTARVGRCTHGPSRTWPATGTAPKRGQE